MIVSSQSIMNKFLIRISNTDWVFAIPIWLAVTSMLILLGAVIKIFHRSTVLLQCIPAKGRCQHEQNVNWHVSTQHQASIELFHMTLGKSGGGTTRTTSKPWNKVMPWNQEQFFCNSCSWLRLHDFTWTRSKQFWKDHEQFSVVKKTHFFDKRKKIYRNVFVNFCKMMEISYAVNVYDTESSTKLPVSPESLITQHMTLKWSKGNSDIQNKTSFIIKKKYLL